MAKNYKVAVIGRTGKGAYGHGLDVVWKTIDNVEIVAVADENEAGRKAAQTRLGAKNAYADYKQMLEKEKPHIKALFEAAESFTIGMKEDLDPGSCLIETDKGVINSTIDLKIKALESAFERFGPPT